MVFKFRRVDYEPADDEKAAGRIYTGSAALAMETGTFLQHQPLIHADYGLSNEQDCVDQFSAHANQVYGNNGAVEPLQRDVSILQQPSDNFTFGTSNSTPGPRFTDRNEPTSYQGAQQFNDSSSGSISTSPSSAASTLGYNAVPSTNYYTGIPIYPTAVSSPHSFVPPTYAGARVPSTYDTSGQALPPLIRSPSTTDRDAYTAPAAYISRGPLSPNVPPGYPYSLDSHRGVLQATAGLSLNNTLPYAAHMANTASHGFGNTQAECANFPWPQLEVLLDMTCEGQPVTPEVHAKVEKGFFSAPVDKKWTCYRRNYFSVNCSFDLHPTVNNGRVYVKRNNGTEQVQAMGMRLQAAVDGSQGKNIELIQHTPKRDNGPKTQIQVVKVAPTPTTGRPEQTMSPHGVYSIPMQTFHATGQVPGPYLPMQNANDENTPPPTNAATSLSPSYYANGSSHIPLPGASTQYTFERVQFKQATANNGKRRASQQFFHLILELFADVRKEGAETANWVKVAQRVSDKIVVRGRSPSHYSNECQNGNAGRGGATGGGSGYGGSGGGAYTGLSGMNPGGFRSVGGHCNASSNGYSARQYGFHPSPEHSGSHSGSSTSSINDGPVDPEYQVDTIMSDADRIALHEHEGYQYYPGTIYEGVSNLPHLPPLAKIESNARYSTEPRQYAVKAEYTDAVPGARYTANGIGRYQGVDSSQGYYPDLSAGYT